MVCAVFFGIKFFDTDTARGVTVAIASAYVHRITTINVSFYHPVPFVASLTG